MGKRRVSDLNARTKNHYGSPLKAFFRIADGMFFIISSCSFSLTRKIYIDFICSLKISTIRSCSSIGGTGEYHDNNCSLLIFGIRARLDSSTAYFVNSSDKSIHAVKWGFRYVLLTVMGYISALHTPAKSATMTFFKYGLNFE